MGVFWKAAAAVLVSAVLQQALGKREKDIGVVLTIAVCCMVGMVVFHYLEPVLDLLWELENLGDLQDGLLGILLKGLGIGLVAEFAAMVCVDAGNGSLAKTIQMLGGTVILYLSVPVFRSLLELVVNILGEI